MPRALFNVERFIHCLKTAAACFLGFAVSQLISSHVDQWLIISILVVMCAQLSVGGVLQKSYMRFLGTLSGSLLAVFTIKVIGIDLISVAIVVAVTGALFSYIATSQTSYSDAGTLGAVTTTIILLAPQPTVSIAAERFLEISVGILIAACISQFVLPIHARVHLRRNQAITFRQLRAYYSASLLIDQDTDKTENYQKLDEAIVKSLITQRKLANDAVREPLKQEFKLESFNQLLSCEKEILRCIILMHAAYKSSTETKKIFSSVYLLQEFHEKLCQVLETIADCLQQKHRTTCIFTLPSTDILKRTLQENTGYLTEHDVMCAHTFLFCAGILLNQLHYVLAIINRITMQSPLDTHE